MSRPRNSYSRRVAPDYALVLSFACTFCDALPGLECLSAESKAGHVKGMDRTFHKQRRVHAYRKTLERILMVLGAEREAECERVFKLYDPTKPSLVVRKT